jgi:hypothetical protein
MFRKRSALRSAKRPMGSGLMRKIIRIPDSRCFHYVVSYYTASDARTLAWPSRMLECQIDAASNLVQ